MHRPQPEHFLQLAAILWSLALLMEGAVVVNGFSRGKAAVLAGIMVSLASLAVYGLRFA